MVQPLRTSPGRRDRWPLIGVCAAFVVATIAGLAFHTWVGFLDLEVYRAGARTILAGYPLYATDPLIAGPQGLGFTYPPSAALAFVPLAVLPTTAAQALFFLSSLGCLGAVLWIVCKRLRPELDRLTTLTVVIAMVTLFEFIEPVRSTLSFGQVNLVLMAAVVFDTLTRARHWPRGMLIGIAMAIKLTPAVFLLFFLLRRDWRALATALASAAATVGAGWLILPADSAQYWLQTVRDTRRIGSSWFANNQSFNGMLTRLPLPEAWQSGLWIALSAVALLLAVRWMRRLLEAGQPVTAVLVNAALVLLVSPISWNHHWVWIAPALLVAGNAVAEGARSPWLVGTVALAVVVFTVGPSERMPMMNDRELHWSWWQHVVGNSYPLLAFAVLAAGAAGCIPTGVGRPRRWAAAPTGPAASNDG